VSGDSDAELALRLLAADPKRFGGIWLRGDPLVAAALLQGWGRPLRRLPLGFDGVRLSGGLDLAASLALGRAVRRDGLIAEAWDECLVVTGAERMPDALAARLAHARDEGGPALVLLDEGRESETRPPQSLLDRIAFHVELGRDGCPACEGSEERGEEGARAAIAHTAEAFGIDSPRALIFAMRAVRALAQSEGRTRPSTRDIAEAARLILGPRAVRLPEQSEDEAPAQDQQREPGQAERLDDLVVDAVRVALPPDLIEDLRQRGKRGGRDPSHGCGARRAGLRGRPTGARQAVPRSGVRLALVETLRAAAPWQRLRAGTDGPPRLRLRKEDLHVRRHEDRETALTIFAVDASGSAAAARLGEAKGAVERLLQRAHAKRAEVALLAFRGEEAQLLLPPTRSLTRARRLLAELPGGGATPLAAGLDAARGVAEGATARSRTPLIVMLSDGRGNIASDGRQGRPQAQADALAAARRIASAGLRAVFIDIGSRRQPEAVTIAGAMSARYLHLPRADAAAIEAAL